VSNAVSGVITNPADVLKVRLQMHAGTASTRAGLLSTLQGIVRTEGPAALMAGACVVRGGLQCHTDTQLSMMPQVQWPLPHPAPLLAAHLPPPRLAGECHA
jgi:hypothetical protein